VTFYVRWHGRNVQVRHPRDMGASEVQQFLSMLATQRRVSVSTHNQALGALLFLYREVLGVQLPWLNNLQRPTRPKRIPSVLTVAEVVALLGAITGIERLLAKLLYGTGMRLTEGLRLRVKDADFDRRVLIVREGKGGKHRVVMLPQSLDASLRAQLAQSRTMWEHDRQQQQPGVEIPDALPVKYPDLGQRWGLVLGISVAQAVCRSAFPHRHSDVSTTMIYTHVIKFAAGGTASPLEALTTV
jgi:site-specific recombinase XerD